VTQLTKQIAKVLVHLAVRGTDPLAQEPGTTVNMKALKMAIHVLTKPHKQHVRFPTVAHGLQYAQIIQYKENAKFSLNLVVVGMVPHVEGLGLILVIHNAVSLQRMVHRQNAQQFLAVLGMQGIPHVGITRDSLFPPRNVLDRGLPQTSFMTIVRDRLHYYLLSTTMIAPDHLSRLPSTMTLAQEHLSHLLLTMMLALAHLSRPILCMTSAPDRGVLHRKWFMTSVLEHIMHRLSLMTIALGHTTHHLW
jgi:hypothetical protein